MRRRTGRTVLNGIVTNLVREIGALSDAELRAVRRRTDSLTQTNCWWIEYHLREGLARVVENEVQWRTHQHRSNAARAREAKRRGTK